MKIIKIASLLLLSIAYELCAVKVVLIDIVKKNDYSVSATIMVDLESNELLYRDHIHISVNNHEIVLSPFQYSVNPSLTNDLNTNSNAYAFNNDFTITVHLSSLNIISLEKTSLIFSLITNQNNSPQLFTLPLNNISLHVLHKDNHHYVTSEDHDLVNDAGIFHIVRLWIMSVPDMIQATHSLLFKIILVFLLGVLMSLTPCIYPMIPITVGVLQSQGSVSLMRNFLLSFLYTLGMATTFACMGLVAAHSGEAFGQILASPIFVWCVVFVLCYFAFSLFGFYSMYIPRFLQKKSALGRNSSLMSIFLFGMASGSVASPCLSPGLALVLTIVIALKNKLLGFILLFAFGVGTSLPLLIIGTFSSSINMLPRAGIWMLHVQKVFGFMLIGMSLYYLNAILPWIGMLILIFVFTGSISIYYLYLGVCEHIKFWKLIKYCIGLFFLIITCQYGYELFQCYTSENHVVNVSESWFTDYNLALKHAQNTGTKLLVDFWAPYCSVCKAITKNVLQNQAIQKSLSQYTVAIIDVSDSSNISNKKAQQSYKITGVPNILIIDPVTEQEVHRWQGELYSMPHTEIISLLDIFGK